MNGGLRLACNAERWTEVKRQATTAHSFGLEMHLLTPSEAKDALAADDHRRSGRRGLSADRRAGQPFRHHAKPRPWRAHGGRAASSRIRLSRGSSSRTGRIQGVETPFGTIECEKVVCCAGQWTRTLAATVGVNVPLVSVEHQYMVTERIEGVTAGPAHAARPRPADLLEGRGRRPRLGRVRAEPQALGGERHPRRLPFRAADLGLGALRAVHGRTRSPGSRRWKRRGSSNSSTARKASRPTATSSWARHRSCGTSTSARASTPSASPRAAGREWRWRNGWPRARRPMTCGPSISAASGASTAPPTGSAPARSRPMASTTPSPGRPRNIDSARPTRRSPLYAHLKAAGACFGEKLGWERPNWFADLAAGEEPVDVYSYQRPGWWNAVAARASGGARGGGADRPDRPLPSSR